MTAREALERLRRLLVDEDDPAEPRYDPAHLAATLVACMAAAGAAFWLLWTLLVFEGGLFPKIGAGLSVLLASRSLKDFGWDPAAGSLGVFEGWLGNLAALALLVLALYGLRRLFDRAAPGPAGTQRPAKRGP